MGADAAFAAVVDAFPAHCTDHARARPARKILGPKPDFNLLEAKQIRVVHLRVGFELLAMRAAEHMARTHVAVAPSGELRILFEWLHCRPLGAL